jgi:hypothetical protein
VPDPDRQPPHNLEAEEAVLGAVLTTGRLLVEVAAVLEEADFYRPAHRTIWRAMVRLADRGEPTDPVTVLGELDHSGELADVGGGPFLHTLIQAVPTVANAGRYAHLVADMARRRRVIDLGIRLAHSDADPAVLASLADELANTTTSGADGRRWLPLIPFGVADGLPAFPVEVLPSWLGEYVAAVATATQTPPDLAGMLALAVLATVAAGAVEVEPRPGWREPLCLFIAVGMDAGARKSSVFSALTRPVAEFEHQQAAAALPAITETATLRRIADQTAASAETAASKAPSTRSKPSKRKPSPEPPKPPTWSFPRSHAGWSMTPPPRPSPGCWPPTAASPSSHPKATCSTRWPAATTSRSAPTSASTSKATPATCSKSTAAAAPLNTWSGPA